MSNDLMVKFKVHFETGRRSRKEIRNGEKPPAPASRIPRISRLMALAIRFEKMLQDGVVADQSELARLGHVTRTRVTQIMNLLSLAPDIQEEILFLPPVAEGREPAWERRIRGMTWQLDWRGQRRMWSELRDRSAESACCLPSPTAT
jgi:hypothetical protein